MTKRINDAKSYAEEELSNIKKKDQIAPVEITPKSAKATEAPARAGRAPGLKAEAAHYRPTIGQRIFGWVRTTIMTGIIAMSLTLAQDAGAAMARSVESAVIQPPVSKSITGKHAKPQISTGMSVKLFLALAQLLLSGRR